MNLTVGFPNFNAIFSLSKTDIETERSHAFHGQETMKEQELVGFFKT